MHVRRITIAALLFAALCACVAQAKPETPGAALLAFVSQSIDWYRHVQLPGQLSTDPGDSIYSTYNQNSSLQTVSLIFEAAREEAVQIQLEHPQDSDPAADNAGATRNLTQFLASAAEKVKQATSDLDALQQKASSGTEKQRRTIADQIAEQQSELALAQARLEAVQNMSSFASAGTSGGLLGKINELERTIPEIRTVVRNVRPMHTEGNHGEGSNNAGAAQTDSENNPASSGSGATRSPNSATSSTSTKAAATNPAMPFGPMMVSSPAAPAAPAKQNNGGILGLAGELFSLNSKLSAQKDAIKATTQLHNSLEHIRDPLTRQLQAVNQRGDLLSAQPQTNDPAVLADRKKQIEALTADFKHLSGILLPLAKASLLLDSTSNNLAEWHNESERTYRSTGRGLLLRLGVLVMALIFVGIASDFWRRAIFRYIREQRRRNQFLLLRRILVTAVIALILIFALSTEIGSLATFAGFLTAGIAVALQNVILSVAAYFFLIGRYGIRVGDRIQIGDVTGDVVDIGLVRLHLVELDTSSGEARPTGRIVVFSNSVVFQPSSNFFKQLPGSNFAWRRISLTLSADVDYVLAEQSISTAVAGVYETYKPELDQQHRVLESSLAIHIASTEPQTRLRLMETGLEIVILYPEEQTQAAEIDDRMTHALLDAIEGEPRLRLVGGGLTNIKPVDATPKPAGPIKPAQVNN
jgi:small-conductance mechanosensitive channel